MAPALLPRLATIAALLGLLGAGAAPAMPVGAPAKPAAERAEGRHLVLSFSGDLLIHSPVYDRALANGGGDSYDFAPFFRRIGPYVRKVDVGFCHVEVPMSNRSPSGYPLFNTPPALAKGIAESGWDFCDTASNHSLDQGQEGIEGTVEALNGSEVEHTGSYPTKRSSRRVAFVRRDGLKIALLAYTTDTNGLVPPHPWSLNVIRDPGEAIADARRARRKGADIVIVNVHWGPSFAPEYSTSVTDAQKEFAKELTDAKAITAVVGQGPHVVQSIEWIHRKPVVFGEGNLISNQTAACCSTYSQDGLIALIRFEVKAGRASPVMIRYVPTFVRHPDYTVLPADQPSLSDSWRRTVGVVERERRIKPIPLHAP